MTVRAPVLVLALALVTAWPAERVQAQDQAQNRGPAQTQTQTEPQPRLDIAVAGGTTSARNWHPHRDPLEHRTRMALVRFHLNSAFAVEAGVGTVQRGFTAIWEIPPADPYLPVTEFETISLTSRQIEASVLLRAAPPRSLFGVRPVALWGFAGSRERSCEARGVVSGIEKGGFGPVLCEVFREDKVDATRIGGLGLELRARGWAATLEARRSVPLFSTELRGLVGGRSAADRTESVIVSVGRAF